MAQLSCGRGSRADVAERSSLGPTDELRARRFRTQSDHLVGFTAPSEYQVNLPINKVDRDISTHRFRGTKKEEDVNDITRIKKNSSIHFLESTKPRHYIYKELPLATNSLEYNNNKRKMLNWFKTPTKWKKEPGINLSLIRNLRYFDLLIPSHFLFQTIHFTLLFLRMNFLLHPLFTYLTAEDQRQQQRHRQLSVAEEYYKQ